MAVWQLLKNGIPTKDDHFDDGLPFGPGDEGFNIDAVQAKASATTGVNGFNYMRKSDVVEVPAE